MRRHEGWADKVQLRRVADHFIFSVETVGNIPPEQIVKEAISVLRNKGAMFLEEVERHLSAEMN